MFPVKKLAAVAAMALAASRAQAAPTAKAPPGAVAPKAAAPDNAQQAAKLWEAEGQTLRELAEVARGSDKAEALLRLGEWERQSAKNLRRDVEDGKIPATVGEAQINQHLDAARTAYAQAESLASPERLPQVLFSLGDLMRFRGDAKSAKEPLAKLVDKQSAHPLAVDAAIALGDDAFDAGNLADAMHRYAFAAKAARTPGSKAYAKYKLAWCHLNLDEYSEARKLFTEVIALTSGAGKKITLADEARRDFVLALARDPQMHADDAEKQIRSLALEVDRTRRYVEGYAKIIAGAGRDEEAMKVFGHIENGAPPPDATRIFTAELEIAIRRRDVQAQARSATQLAQVVSAFPKAAGDAAEAAEHALRVAAVTVHGEGRARGDNAMLETAVALYMNYFLAFDHSPAAYELHHHAGELLASMKRPADAERQYTAAVEVDLARLAKKEQPGKWLDSSAQGAVTAAQDALPATAQPARQPPPNEEDVDHPAPKPTVLSEPEKVFVAACDRYLKALPQGSQAVEVQYQRALMLYRHNELDEAERSLRQVALEHPADVPAEFAAQLSMDALRQLGRYDEMAKVSALYLDKAPLRSKLGTELESTREAALVASAAREAKHKNYQVAAQRYQEFVKQFPKSPLVDRALYNAAAALVEEGKLSEAIAVRDRLLREFPDSSLASRAREHQLSELLKLGRFSEGERLAVAVADDADGAEAANRLRDAVVLAEAAGDTRSADNLRQTYLKEHAHGPDAMVYALTLGEHARGCEASLKAYQKALALSPDTAWRTVALDKLARQELRCHKEALAKQHAAEAAAMAPHLKKERADALDASADASLLLTEPLMADYRKLPLREPYQRTLPKKLSSLKSVDDKLAKVVARGRAEPAVCALVSSGQAYGDLAKALNNAPAPRSFNEEQKELFKEQLAEKSQPLFDRAKTTLMEAITRAREAGVAPSCLNDARKSLASLWPERFGTLQEAVVSLGPNMVTATASAAEILAKDPDKPAAWLAAAQAELAGGHPQAAIVLANRVEAKDQLYPEALEMKARALDALGQAEPALALWLKLVKEYPTRTLARRVLADRTLASRDLEAAKEHLLALRQVDAKDAAVALNLGVVLRGLGDIEGAEKATRTAAELDPKRLEATLNLGLLLCDEAGRPAEGVAALEKFVQAGGRPPDAHGFEAALAACRALAKEKK